MPAPKQKTRLPMVDKDAHRGARSTPPLPVSKSNRGSPCTRERPAAQKEGDDCRGSSRYGHSPCIGLNGRDRRHADRGLIHFPDRRRTRKRRTLRNAIVAMRRGTPVRLVQGPAGASSWQTPRRVLTERDRGWCCGEAKRLPAIA